MSDRISRWLEQLGLSQYAEVFQRNEIEWDQLPKLTNDDLKELGINALGHRKKILESVESIAAGESSEQENKNFTSRYNSSVDYGEAERRQITVMFCDLVGSTALSESVDPEKYREIITNYRSATAAVIKYFSGYIATYMGDGLLVYFGYPQAHEDDAERAVRTGLAIVEAVSKLTSFDNQPLRVRIGISTGIVVAGDVIGEGTSEERAVLGDTPNLAARLQGVANPDEIVISESTRRLLGRLFSVVALGEHRLKGISAPVKPYKVNSERLSETRFTANHSQISDEMVGRQQELALLVDLWHRAKAGEGQVIILIGEAGIGKSRLVHSLLETLSHEAKERISYQCSPYHTDTPFYPIVQQLSIAASFSTHDTDEQKLNKLLGLLNYGSKIEREDAAIISALVGLVEASEARYGALDYSPQQRRIRSLQAIVDHLELRTKQDPLLFLVEDAHWIDPTTLEMLHLLASNISLNKVMLVMTSRPTTEIVFDGQSSATHLTLNRLSREQMSSIILRITKGKTLPAGVVKEIVSKTDGFPLYVEEVTKAILESGQLRETSDAYVQSSRFDHVTVPSSLHDSLMARLDRLQPVKEVAQTASCIGREFSYSLLAAISNLAERLLCEALSILVDAQLIVQDGNIPEATFRFKHALVRETAHNSLLLSNRRVIHGQIVDVLSEDPNSGSELLALHCTESERIGDAIFHWKTAGQLSVDQSANREAIEQLETAISLLPMWRAESDKARIELELRVLLGVAQQACLGYAAPAINENYKRAHDLCVALDSLPDRIPVLRGLYVFNLMRGDLSLAHEFAQQLLKIAELSDDGAQLVEAYFAIGQTHFFHIGDLEQATKDFDRAIHIYDVKKHGSHGYRFGQDPGVYCLQLLALALQIRGFSDASLERSMQARELAEQIGHPLSLASAYVFASQLHQWRDEPEIAVDLASIAIDISERQALPFFAGWARLLVGWSQSEGVDWKSMDAGLQMFADSGTGLGFTIASAVYAGAELRARRIDSAQGTLNTAIEHANRCGEPYILPELLRLRAKAYLLAGATDKAIDSLHKSIQSTKDIKARFWQLRAMMDLLATNQHQGTSLDTEFRALLGWFSEGLDTPDLKRAQHLLNKSVT